MKKNLKEIKYFQNLNYTTYIDSLTNTINSDNIVNYCKELIAGGEPFAVAFLNLDNFKLINDSYGVNVGDIVISQYAQMIKEGLQEDGVVGRQKGDQFMIILNGEYTYDKLHARIKQLREEYLKAKNPLFQTLDAKITSTIGCAIFPQDAIDYDTLMIKCNKALFRGKAKGRNCFIIYVDEKHKNIELKKNVEVTTTAMREIQDIMTSNKDTLKKITNAMSYIVDFLTLTEGYLYIDGKLYTKVSEKNNFEPINYSLIENTFDEQGVINVNNYSDLKESNLNFHLWCSRNKIKSLVVKDLTYNGKRIGYVMFMDGSIKRIWQAHDRNIISFFAYETALLLNK